MAVGGLGGDTQQEFGHLREALGMCLLEIQIWELVAFHEEEMKSWE